jgi:hypothetical protein
MWAWIDWQQKLKYMRTAKGVVSPSVQRKLESWCSNGDENLVWKSFTSEQELCSSDDSVAIITWALLWTDPGTGAITGEAVELLRAVASNIVEDEESGVQRALAAIEHGVKHGTEGIWKQRELTQSTDYKQKKKRKKLSQQGIDQYLEPTRLPAINPSDVPIPIRWHETTTQTSSFDRDGWSSEKPLPPGKTRVVSQNIGPVGAKRSERLIDMMVHRQRPAVLMLQDGRMAKDDKEDITGLFRRQWPEYQVFVSSVLEERGRMRVKKRKKGYWATVITMIHKSCGEGQKCKIRGTESPETGRVMSVKITQKDGREVVITNVYQHVASRLKEQDEIWREVKRRVVETGKDGILHIIGGDMNASLFPDRRQGYDVGEYQLKADQGFRELVYDGEISGGWVVGRVEEEGITRVDGKAGKRARIDEILISDGRRLSQIAKGNLNTVFMEYALHTLHTGQGN